MSGFIVSDDIIGVAAVRPAAPLTMPIVGGLTMGLRKITQHRLPFDFHGETKTCRDCQEPKPLSEFHKRTAERDGLNARCKPCARARLNANRRANKGRERARDKGYRDRLKRNDPDYRYERDYGMKKGEYAELLMKQGGKCAICETTQNIAGRNRMCVDHCHDTGKVRGLLCVKCNAGIGMLNDDLELVESAVKYLKETSNV